MQKPVSSVLDSRHARTRREYLVVDDRHQVGEAARQVIRPGSIVSPRSRYGSSSLWVVPHSRGPGHSRSSRCLARHPGRLDHAVGHPPAPRPAIAMVRLERLRRSSGCVESTRITDLPALSRRSSSTMSSRSADDMQQSMIVKLCDPCLSWRCVEHVSISDRQRLNEAHYQAPTTIRKPEAQRKTQGTVPVLPSSRQARIRFATTPARCRLRRRMHSSIGYKSSCTGGHLATPYPLTGWDSDRVDEEAQLSLSDDQHHRRKAGARHAIC